MGSCIRGSQKGTNMAYSWTPEQGYNVWGIHLNSNLRDQRIPCPNCNGHNFIVNVAGGFGRCPQCNFSADSASYGARLRGISTFQARKEIEEFWGYNKDDWKKEKQERTVINTEPKKVEEKRASEETLDATYRAFMMQLKLKDEGRFEMKARCGMDDNTIEALNYKSYPVYKEVNFFQICKTLLAEGYTLEGVPGFFKCKNGAGDWMFPSKTEGILMPMVNHKNQIIGLQLRKHDEKRVYIDEGDVMKLEAKCSWFSSAGFAKGTSAKSGIHYACDWKYDAQKNCYVPVIPQGGVVVTEGIMKADIIHYLMPNLPVLAVQGVQNTQLLERELLRVKEFGVDTVLLAYDMDYHDNPNVQDALAATRKIILNAGMHYQSYDWETKIADAPEVYLKGLDDFLAYAIRGIVPKVKQHIPDEVMKGGGK